MAICLEDSVGHQERENAVENTGRQLEQLDRAPWGRGILPRDCMPLLFVRVKDADMLERMADLFVRYSTVLTGVVLPKVCRADLERYLRLVSDINSRAKDPPRHAHPGIRRVDACGDRVDLLRELRRSPTATMSTFSNMRVGATDLCGLYGIRRGPDTPIYSVTMVANCIADGAGVRRGGPLHG